MRCLNRITAAVVRPFPLNVCSSPRCSSGPPHVSKVIPPEGPKEGGMMLRVEGAAFVESTDLACRFSRLDPATNTPIHKTASATYVSPTAVLCESPAWEEDDCPNCDATALSGAFSGHSGSRYVRSTSTTLTKNLGIGSYLKLTGVTNIGHVAAGTLTPMTQTFQVEKLEACTGTHSSI